MHNYLLQHRDIFHSKVQMHRRRRKLMIIHILPSLKLLREWFPGTLSSNNSPQHETKTFVFTHSRWKEIALKTCVMSFDHALEPEGMLVPLVCEEGSLLNFLLADKQFEMSLNYMECQQQGTEKEEIRLMAAALSLTNWVVLSMLLHPYKPVFTAIKQEDQLWGDKVDKNWFRSQEDQSPKSRLYFLLVVWTWQSLGFWALVYSPMKQGMQ